ncbi:MAG TPA: DUF6335 family protein [Polyangiaceae bacterium]|nr:DUF6335 family protein [Polyangiaceae bacterium]
MKKRAGKGKTQAKGKTRAKGDARRTRVRPKTRRKPARRAQGAANDAATTGLLVERISHSDASPRLTGGDIDADWQRAASDGEEAVGGSVATPDQDVVDEIGRALGVEQASTAPVVTSDEILRDRDRRRWELERRAEREKRRR